MVELVETPSGESSIPVIPSTDDKGSPATSSMDSTVTVETLSILYCEGSFVDSLAFDAGAQTVVLEFVDTLPNPPFWIFKPANSAGFVTFFESLHLGC